MGLIPRASAALVGTRTEMEAEMRRVHVLPSGDVQVFSVFHARLLEASELGAWGRRLSDDKARAA